MTRKNNNSSDATDGNGTADVEDLSAEQRPSTGKPPPTLTCCSLKVGFVVAGTARHRGSSRRLGLLPTETAERRLGASTVLLLALCGRCEDQASEPVTYRTLASLPQRQPQ